jgi:hypothetical protein
MFKKKLTSAVITTSLLGASLTCTSVQAGWFDDHISHPLGKGIAKTVESIGKDPIEVLPPCWGSPQDCRDDKHKNKPPQIIVPSPTYSVTYRVDCRDAITGADRADNTITVTSTVSVADAQNEVIRRLQSSDLCQANGDTSRVTKPGSGRWL